MLYIARQQMEKEEIERLRRGSFERDALKEAKGHERRMDVEDR